MSSERKQKSAVVMPPNEALFVETLRGVRPKKDWATHYVETRDWDSFAAIHPLLPSLTSDLKVGLASLLLKHEKALHNPMFHIGGDELEQLETDLCQMRDGLTHVGEMLFGPDDNDGGEDHTDAAALSHSANARLMHLALPKRGDTLGKHGNNLDPSEVMGRITRYRAILMGQLAEQVHIETLRDGRSKKLRKPQPHPFIKVATLTRTLRAWAQRADATLCRIASASRKREELKTAFNDDLWELWGPHLAKLGKTSKGKLWVPSKVSDAFTLLSDHLLIPFMPPRKREQLAGRLGRFQKAKAVKDEN